MATTTPDQLTVLQQILDAFNRHDVEAILAYFAEDCRYDAPRGTAPGGTAYIGKAAVREGFAQRFAGLPDARWSEDHHWGCGDRAVSEWLLTGTTLAGERLAVRGCDLWEFRAGTVVRKDSYWKIVG